MNKSEQIRSLYEQGYKVQEIADRMGIRYQFAYNVVKHHIKSQHLDTVRGEIAASTPQPFSFWRWITGR